MPCGLCADFQLEIEIFNTVRRATKMEYQFKFKFNYDGYQIRDILSRVGNFFYSQTNWLETTTNMDGKYWRYSQVYDIQSCVDKDSAWNIDLHEKADVLQINIHEAEELADGESVWSLWNKIM